MPFKPSSQLKQLCTLGLTGLLVLLMSACSSDNPREPKPIVKIKAEVLVTQVWKRSIGSGDRDQQLQLKPLFIDDQIYALDADGDLVVLSAERGKRIASHDFDERIAGGLGADSERLFYTTFEGEVVAVERKTFRELWRKRLTSEVVAPPVSDGRQVYVQSVDGKLVALDVRNGIQVWRHDSLDPILTLRGTAPVVLAGGHILASFANGELIAFDAEAGAIRWKVAVGLPQGRTELERLVDVDGAPVVSADILYAIAYQGKLMALDLRHGYERWSKPLSSYHSVAALDEVVYAADSDGLVWALNGFSGEVRWKSDDLQYRQLSGPAVFGQAVVVADFEGYLHFLAREDGRIIARKTVDSDGIMGPMVVRGERLYVTTRSGELHCYEYVK